MSIEVERGIKEGWIDPPKRAELGEPLLLNSRLTIAEVLDEDRGD